MEITILVNNRPFKTESPQLTGLQIKELAGGPLDYLLVLIVKEPDATAGGDDQIINDNQLVTLKDGMRFRLVNPATFGDESERSSKETYW